MLSVEESGSTQRVHQIKNRSQSVCPLLQMPCEREVNDVNQITSVAGASHMRFLIFFACPICRVHLLSFCSLLDHENSHLGQ